VVGADIVSAAVGTHAIGAVGQGNTTGGAGVGKGGKGGMVARGGGAGVGAAEVGAGVGGGDVVVVSSKSARNAGSKSCTARSQKDTESSHLEGRSFLHGPFLSAPGPSIHNMVVPFPQ